MLGIPFWCLQRQGANTCAANHLRFYIVVLYSLVFAISWPEVDVAVGKKKYGSGDGDGGRVECVFVFGQKRVAEG